MKKLMYVTTNAYDVIVSYDKNEKILRFLIESNENPFPKRNAEGQPDLETIKDFLRNIEGDSSWDYKEDVENVEKFFGIDYSNPETARIIAEIETDLL